MLLLILAHQNQQKNIMLSIDANKPVISGQLVG